MIARMKKFYLFFASGEEKVLREMQKTGIVEIQTLPEDFGFKISRQKETEVEEKLKKIDFLKSLIQKTPNKILISEEEEQKTIGEFPLEETFNKFNSLQSLLKKKEKTDKRIKSLLSEIFPFENLEIAPASLHQMKRFSFFFFLIEEKNIKDLEQLKKYPLEEIKVEKKQRLFLVLFPENEREYVEKILKNLNVKFRTIRPFRKKIPYVIKKLTAISEKNQQEKEILENKLKEVSVLKNEIFVLSDYLKTYRHYIHTKKNFLSSSRYIKGFSGWIKEKNIPYLKNLLKKSAPGNYLFVRDPEEGEETPVALENSPLIQPFEVVTDLYGKPVYKGLDPTTPLSLFFILAFAFCLTDAGYGIILIVLSLLFMKKFKFFPTPARALKLLLYCGIATVIAGSITGGWFGDLPQRMPANFAITRFFKKIEVINPLESGEKALILLKCSLIFGYIQLLWGLFLNLFHSLKQFGLKKAREALVLFSIQILAGLIILAFLGVKKIGLPLFTVKILGGLLILNFLYLAFLKSREQKEIMLKIFWFIYGPYGVIADNLLGHPLSYSRLFGLGLTTAVLGLVINEMVHFTKQIPYIGFIAAGVVFIIGHLGNLAINLLGAYVHTSRLQYLEFFSKFFESGGKPFSPFSEVREYTVTEQKPM